MKRTLVLVLLCIPVIYTFLPSSQFKPTFYEAPTSLLYPKDTHIDVTVILNVYNRVSSLDRQLQLVFAQTYPIHEVWVCAFHSPVMPDIHAIVSKYPQVKVINSDINFKYYGRFQLGAMAETSHVLVYDDDQMPNRRNLELLVDAALNVAPKDSILGLTGRLLNPVPAYSWSTRLRAWFGGEDGMFVCFLDF